MTALRLVSLPLHSALELVAGLALMGLPFALGLSTAGMLAGALVGALMVGLALQSLDVGPQTTSVSAHHAADLGVAVGLAGAAVVFAAAGDATAWIFGAAALTQLGLNLTTRYTLR